MEDNRFEIEDGILIRYNEDGSREVTVPEGISEISEYAFAGCEELQRITVPKGVKKIGQKAFWGCSELREIILPEGLEYIDRFAFWECGDLESIVIPEGVKSIGNSAFRGCDMLRRAVLPDSLENIGESAFSDCVSLEEINIPKGLKIIKKRVFSDCNGLVRLCVPDNIVELDDYAFECCGALGEIILPDGLKKIGRHAFSGCRILKDIQVPKSVESIGSSAFHNTPLIDESPDDLIIVGDGILLCFKGESENAVIPGNVKTVGERAFAYCEALKSVTIPEGVCHLGDYAFEHCTALEKVSLPQSLAYLGSRAFVDCTELGEITLPDSISRIGSDVFYGTRLLGENTDEMLVFNGKYLISYTGQAEELDLPDGIRVIADGAFTGCDTLNTVRIGANTNVIGDGAFKWCQRLRRADIPSSVNYIGAEAFGSSGELHAHISCGEMFIGEGAFAYGAKLTLENNGKSFTVTMMNDMPADGCEQYLFRFAEKPSREYFDGLELPEYKLPAAICHAEDDEYYRSYVRENIREAVCHAVDSEDTELLNRVMSFGFLSEEDTEYCVAHAIESKRLEQQITLMRFKQETFGSKDVGEIIGSKFEL